MRSFSLIVIIFWILFIVGYIQGIVKLTKCDFKPDYKAEVFYGVGAVTGLNGIIGWFDIGEIE